MTLPTHHQLLIRYWLPPGQDIAPCQPLPTRACGAVGAQIETQARQQNATGWIAAQVAVVYLHITAHTCRKEKRVWSKGTSKGSYAVIEWERSALDLAPGSSWC